MRKAKFRDRRKLLNYIQNEPEMTLFFYGDLKAWRLFSHLASFYIHQSPDGKYDLLLLKYFDNYEIYTQKDSCSYQDVASFLEGKKVDCLSGKDSLVRPLERYFPQLQPNMATLYRLDADTLCFLSTPLEEGYVLKELNKDNLKDIVDFIVKIPSLAQNYKGSDIKAQIRKRIAANLLANDFYGGIYKGHLLVSLLGTSATNDKSCVITSFATLPAERNKGLGSRVLAAACKKLFKNGLQFVCLFTDDYKVGRICLGLGFKSVGHYTLLH
jgi:predicted GNAT family acetyltransferase